MESRGERIPATLVVSQRTSWERTMKRITVMSAIETATTVKKVQKWKSRNP